MQTPSKQDIALFLRQQCTHMQAGNRTFARATAKELREAVTKHTGKKYPKGAAAWPAAIADLTKMVEDITDV